MTFSTAQQRLPEVFVKMIEVNKAISNVNLDQGNIVSFETFKDLHALRREKSYIRQECVRFIQDQRGGGHA